VARVVTFAVAALAAAALLGAADGSASPAQNARLIGTVGPGFSIVLTNAQGARVTRLDPGTYDVEVRDLSFEHNFRLTGPGVTRVTGVEEQGTENWTVTLTDGTYRFLCDPHSSTMRGSFAVGNAATQPAPAPTPPARVVTPKTRLVLQSGPDYEITLKTAAGAAVRTMKRGTYTIVVRDRSRIHNAHVRGPGFDRATTLTFQGTQRWRARLARTGTLRFLCDPHVFQGMRGSARIVR
jgi:plastocyanin